MHPILIKERISVFIAVPAAIEALEIAPRLGQRRERCKQFVTARMFEGMSRCLDVIDDFAHAATGLRPLQLSSSQFGGYTEVLRHNFRVAGDTGCSRDPSLFPLTAHAQRTYEKR